MCPAYFVTEFDVRESAADWPREFVIISAFATTGETWTDEQNQACDKELEKALQERHVWMRRVTGRSPSGDYAEPSWAAELPFAEACDLGSKFKQTAIYTSAMINYRCRIATNGENSCPSADFGNGFISGTT